MKTATLTAACLTCLLAASRAEANHQVYRTLDDLVFDAMHDTRDARWEIHDHFDTSRDFVPLLEDADALTHALRDVQDAVYREDRPERLTRLIDAAHAALLHFQEHVEHSDFASPGHGRIEYRGGGYTYHSTRHAGSAHVRTVQRLLDHVDSHLHEMDEAVRHAFGHGHAHDPYIEGPALPAVPDGAPGIAPPGPSAEAISFPLLGGRFRIRFD